MKLWKQIKLFIRWFLWPWHREDNIQYLMSLLPRTRRSSVDDVVGFYCRAYNCHIIFLLTSTDHIRFLIRDWQVINTAMVPTLKFNLRTRWDTYSYIKSRLVWEATKKDSNWPAKQVI